MSAVTLQFFVYCAIVAAAHGVVYYEQSRECARLGARLSVANTLKMTLGLIALTMTLVAGAGARQVPASPDQAMFRQESPFAGDYYLYRERGFE